MQLSFKTRQAARQFNAERLAKGFKGKVVDNGPKHPKTLSRYAVTLR